MERESGFDPFADTEPRSRQLFQSSNSEDQDIFASGLEDSRQELLQHGRDLELLIISVVQRFGYEVADLAGERDHGADLIISKNGERTAVQIKCSTRAVRIGAVKQAIRAKFVYKTDRGMVITNSDYTTQAKRKARDEKIKLLTGTDLRSQMTDEELVNLTSIERRAKEMAPILAQLGRL